MRSLATVAALIGTQKILWYFFGTDQKLVQWMEFPL